jgi:hypothetical protein
MLRFVNDPPVRRPSAEIVERIESESVSAVLRSATWRGPWEPPESMTAVSVLGNVVLDYREADLPPGRTDLECEVYLGNIEIFVPRGVQLELSGSVFLGAVETTGGSAGPGPAPDDERERPLLCIECSGFMGNVEVKLG